MAAAREAGAARDPSSASVRKAVEENPSLRPLPPFEAVAGAEVVFLATPYPANAAALAGLETALAGKVLVDCPNPVGAGLIHALDSWTSGAEEVPSRSPSTSST